MKVVAQRASLTKRDSGNDAAFRKAYPMVHYRTPESRSYQGQPSHEDDDRAVATAAHSEACDQQLRRIRSHLPAREDSAPRTSSSKTYPSIEKGLECLSTVWVTTTIEDMERTVPRATPVTHLDTTCGRQDSRK